MLLNFKIAHNQQSQQLQLNIGKNMKKNKKPTADARRSSDSSSRSSSSSTTTKELPLLLQLIREKNWREVRRCLKSPRSRKALSLCRETDESNLTCLSLAMASDAPIEIIGLIHKVDPTLICRCDDYGATALHLGCLNGASLEAVKFLIGAKEDLVTELDFDDRSALHHAVDFACNKVEDVASSVDDEMSSATNSHKNNSRTNNSNGDCAGFLENVLSVVNELCKTAPQMVHVQDSNGGTPIDLTQVVKAKHHHNSEEYAQLDRIYQLLSRTSVHIYLQNKKRWEAQGVAMRDNAKKGENAQSVLGGVPGQSRAESQSSGSSGSRSSAHDYSSIQTPQSRGSCFMNLSVLDEENDEEDVEMYDGCDNNNQQKERIESNLVISKISSYQHPLDRKIPAVHVKTPLPSAPIKEDTGLEGSASSSSEMDVDC